MFQRCQFLGGGFAGYFILGRNVGRKIRTAFRQHGLVVRGGLELVPDRETREARPKQIEGEQVLRGIR